MLLFLGSLYRCSKNACELANLKKNLCYLKIKSYEVYIKYMRVLTFANFFIDFSFFTLHWYMFCN